MAVTELYSKRRKRELGIAPDTVTYDQFSIEFRNQLQFLLDDMLGTRSEFFNRPASHRDYGKVVKVICRELGKRFLASEQNDFYEDLHAFVHFEKNIDHILDVVQESLSVSQHRLVDRQDVVCTLNN